LKQFSASKGDSPRQGGAFNPFCGSGGFAN
jgi:hypothetical protein